MHNAELKVIKKTTSEWEIILTELTAISLSIVLGIPATATLIPRLSTSLSIGKSLSKSKQITTNFEGNKISTITLYIAAAPF